MIKYISLNNYHSYSNIQKLWNDEVGYIFPITDRLLSHHFSNSPFLAKDISYVALIEDEVVGFIIAKTYNEDDIPLYSSRGWISLFYVSKSKRRKGIGSKLLEMTLNGFKKLGKTECHIGQDLGNFFPGIPCDFDNLTDRFLEKRGFKLLGYTHDLLWRKKGNISKEKTLPYTYRFLKESDKDKLLSFMEKNFPGRWQYEAKKYFLNETKYQNYYIALDGEKVIAFIRVNDETNENISYNINWYQRFNKLVGIGPLGVDRDYRNQGISKEIMLSLLLTIDNDRDVLIDWTGLLEYYQKYGFEVWKCYMKAKIDLK